MKVFLRQVGTGQLLAPGGAWTSEVPLAMDFQKTADAVLAASREAAAPLEVLLRFFEEPQYDIVIPLDRAPRPKTWMSEQLAEPWPSHPRESVIPAS